MRVKVNLYLIKILFKALIILSVFIYIALDLSNSYQKIPLHWDEYIFISRARFFDLYKNLDLKNPKFLTFESYNTQKFPEYIYGFVIFLNGNKNISEYLSRVNFNKENKDSPVPLWYTKDLLSNKEVNRYSSQYQSRIRPIIIGREASLIISILSLFTVFLIGLILKSWLLGIVQVLILFFNPIFKTTMLRVMAEGPLIFFSLIFFLVSLFFLKKYSRGEGVRKQVLILGLISGIIMSTKFTGIITVFYFLSIYALFFIFTRKKEIFFTIF